MTMKKYAQGEGKLDIFRGPEAEVVNRHLAKTGKSLEDFSEEERKAFHEELDSVTAELDSSDEEESLSE
jgi:hypothetical protein